MKERAANIRDRAGKEKAGKGKAGKEGAGKEKEKVRGRGVLTTGETLEKEAKWKCGSTK